MTNVTLPPHTSNDDSGIHRFESMPIPSNPSGKCDQQPTKPQRSRNRRVQRCNSSLNRSHHQRDPRRLHSRKSYSTGTSGKSSPKSLQRSKSSEEKRYSLRRLPSRKACSTGTPRKKSSDEPSNRTPRTYPPTTRAPVFAVKRHSMRSSSHRVPTIVTPNKASQKPKDSPATSQRVAMELKRDYPPQKPSWSRKKHPAQNSSTSTSCKDTKRLLDDLYAPKNKVERNSEAKGKFALDLEEILFNHDRCDGHSSNSVNSNISLRSSNHKKDLIASSSEYSTPTQHGLSSAQVRSCERENRSSRNLKEFFDEVMKESELQDDSLLLDREKQEETSHQESVPSGLIGKSLSAVGTAATSVASSSVKATQRASIRATQGLSTSLSNSVHMAVSASKGLSSVAIKGLSIAVPASSVSTSKAKGFAALTA